METFLAHKDAWVAVALIGIALATALIFAVHYWHKLRREEMLIALKQDLAARGMSAEEIRTVIEATPRNANHEDAALSPARKT